MSDSAPNPRAPPFRDAPAIVDRLDAFEREYAELETRLADPAVGSDPAELRRVSTRYHQLGPLVDAARRRRTILADREAAGELLAIATDDERGRRSRPNWPRRPARLEAVEAELRALLVPPDPHAGRNVIVEIRGAEGGEEANLFARDLYEMYQAYAARHGLEGRDAVVGSERSRRVQRGHVPRRGARAHGPASSTRADRTGCSGCR